MLPPGHLAVGYLLYSAANRLAGTRVPSAGAAVSLAVGTQFPDLVDKPLSWSLGVLPTGRTLAHSAVTAAIVIPIVVRSARAVDRTDVARAFGIGWASHLLGDLFVAVLHEAESPWFFLWPIVSQERYETVPSFRTFFASIGWGEAAIVGYFVAFALAAAVLSSRVGRDGRTYATIVLAIVATSSTTLVWIGDGPAGWVVEFVLLHFAVATWIRDGAPGLPRRSGPMARGTPP